MLFLLIPSHFLLKIIIIWIFLLPLVTGPLSMWILELATKASSIRIIPMGCLLGSCLVVLLAQVNITQDLIGLCYLFEPFAIFICGIGLCVRVVPFGQLIEFLFNFSLRTFFICQSKSRVVVTLKLEFCRKESSPHLINLE